MTISYDKTVQPRQVPQTHRHCPTPRFHSTHAPPNPPPTQIATVNKLKQKLRNAIAADLSLAVPFLRLAINDGLGYDAAVR